MYEKYWKLGEKPFENTPNTKFFFKSQQHENVLMKMLYCTVEAKGAGMITGAFGCGKTMVIQMLMDELGTKYRTAFISFPHMASVELLRTIASALGKEEVPQRETELINCIRTLLENNLKDGKENLIIIDEGHTIKDEETFEALRMLLNFQMKDRFLFTLILSGQTELVRRVSNVKQLAQRIAVNCSIENLSLDNTMTYIKHRLKVAGNRTDIFTDQAIEAVYKYSGGIPRRINHICDAALLEGFINNLKNIEPDTVEINAKALEI